MSVPRTLLATALAAAALATPAAADPTVGTDLVYTVTASDPSGSLTASCVFRPDRWTADYGPTHVYAQAESPFASWTRIRCTITKGGTTWVDQEAFEYGPVAVIDAGDGTIPVEGITVCAEIESQLTVDVRPYAKKCQTF